jgi:hypothetical protein
VLWFDTALMSPLADLVRSLPLWVQWLPSVFYSCLAVAVLLPLTWWLEHRLLRPSYALPSDAHWTERARLGFPVMSVLLSWVILATLLVGSAWLVWLGRLTPLYVGLPATLATLLVTILSARRAMHFVAPERPRVSVRGFLFLVLTRFSSVLLFASLWFVPLGFGWTTWFVLLALAVAFVLGVFGLWIRLAVLLRIARPADAQLTANMAEACRALGLPEVDGIIAPIPVVNAFAEVPGRMVLITKSLLTHLDPEECALVIRQELLAFRHRKSALLFRLLGALVHLPLALLFPVRANFGSTAVLLLMSLVVLAILLLRTIEARVDASRERTPSGPVYARVLEKIHALNGVPAVLRGPAHLSLYARMEQAGVEPSYPRPAPPPRRFGPLVVAFTLATVALVGTRIGVMWVEVRWGSQLDAIHAVVGSTGGDADAFAQLGYARYRASDLPGAITAYEAASSLRPNDAAALALVARLHGALGECDEAREAAFRASAVSARRGDPAMEMMMRNVRRETEECRQR